MQPTNILLTKCETVLALGVVSALQREEDFTFIETPSGADGFINHALTVPSPDAVVVEISADHPFAAISHKFSSVSRASDYRHQQQEKLGKALQPAGNRAHGGSRIG